MILGGRGREGGEDSLVGGWWHHWAAGEGLGALNLGLQMKGGVGEALMRACVRAGVRAGVCVCVCACLT